MIFILTSSCFTVVVISKIVGSLVFSKIAFFTDGKIGVSNGFFVLFGFSSTINFISQVVWAGDPIIHAEFFPYEK